MFLHVGLKPDTARYRCRMNIIESALERVWTRVYNHKIFHSGIDYDVGGTFITPHGKII